MVLVTAAPKISQFTSVIPWEGRKWEVWEKTLYTSFQNPALGVALALFVVPLSVLTLPFMPLISLALLRAPPPPTGRYEVGMSDVQQKLLSMSGEPMLRMRVFYPTESPSRERPTWLPPGPAAGRYATAHGDALPFPKRVRLWLAPFLMWFIRHARMSERVSRDVPPSRAAEHGAASGWPLVLFSHGLYGCAAGYSGLCAELASHGSCVVALEHKDGSAVYTETDDGEAITYNTELEREAQQRRRVDEVRAVLGGLDDLRSQVEHLSQGELAVDSSAVTLVGHSFGSSTALRGAAELDHEKIAPKVSAVIAHDPWISGYDCQDDGTAGVPTLAVLTQSMMYPGNEEPLARVMRSVSSKAVVGGSRSEEAAVALIEARETRHQEVSDYPSINHLPLRFFCMACSRDPHSTHRQQTELAVGFLALAGVLSADDGGALATARELTRRLMTKPTAEGVTDEEGARFAVHGSVLPKAWTAPSAPVKAAPAAAAAATTPGRNSPKELI